MSENNWYSLTENLHNNFNKGKDLNSFYQIERNIYFRDLINCYVKKPEYFSDSMVLDMNLLIVSKINKILTFSLINNERQEKELSEQLINVVQKNTIFTNKKSLNINLFTGRSITADFSHEINNYSSKGQKNYISELKTIQADLALFKTPEWYSHLNSDLLFRNFDVVKSKKTVGLKNFLLSLDKYFPFLKTDENYMEIKNIFFKSYYQKINEIDKNFFYHAPFSEIVSFLKDSYDEDTLKHLIHNSKNIPDYSYLKNKAAIDKIISLFPESKEILNAYINEIREDSIDDIFVKSTYKIITIEIDFTSVEKLLLLDKVKSTAFEIKEKFISLLTNETNKKNDNPLAWFFQKDDINITAQQNLSSLLFKVPENKYLDFGEDFIINFIKKHFLDFVNLYPKTPVLDCYNVLWQEAVINRDVENISTNTVKKSVKKF